MRIDSTRKFADARVELVSGMIQKRRGFTGIAFHTCSPKLSCAYSQKRNCHRPAIEDGFYYDFDVEEPFTPEDLSKVEREISGL